MQAAGKLAAAILSEASKLCRPGVPTEAIDQLVHRLTIEAGAYPSPLKYGSPPFPKSVCTSVNEVICHGIPDARKLRNGDIVNVDVTVWLDGYHGDTSRCVCRVYYLFLLILSLWFVLQSVETGAFQIVMIDSMLWGESPCYGLRLTRIKHGMPTVCR
jgi:hypothetical protein